MLVSFIRYLKGFVVFRATGKSPERFMNICAQRGINLWNARPEGGGIGEGCPRRIIKISCLSRGRRA